MKILHWPQLSGLLLALFLLLSPVLPLDGLRLAVLLALVAGELWCSRQRASVASPPLDWRPLLIWLPWLLWGLLSSLWSAQPDYSLYYWLNEMLFAALVFFLGLRLAQRQANDGWLFAGLALMAGLLAALSAAHLLWPQQVPLYLPGILDNEPQATLYLVLAQLAAVAWLIRGGARGWIIGIGVLLAIALAAWVAGKRSAYLALLTLAVLPLPWLWRAGLARALCLRVTLVLLLFALLGGLAARELVSSRPAAFKPGVGMVSPGLRSTVVHSDRYAIWRFWLEKGMASPWLGTGAGRYLPQQQYAAQVPPGIDPWSRTHGHNLWLNQWLQLGLPGLFFYSLIWLWLAVRLWPGQSDANCQYANVLRALAFCGLLAMLIRNGTDDVLFGASGAAWWLVIAFMYQRTRRIA